MEMLECHASAFSLSNCKILTVGCYVVAVLGKLKGTYCSVNLYGAKFECDNTYKKYIAILVVLIIVVVACFQLGHAAISELIVSSYRMVPKP